MSSRLVSASKDELRTEFREYRSALTETEWRRYSSVVVHRALAQDTIAAAQTIHVYWPLVDRGEIDTRPLITALRSWNVDIVLPVVTSFDPESPTLAHRRYTGPDDLTTNRWGIPEPEGTVPISPSALDAVLVPALGAGENGHRIGHGFGYYDSFLRTVSCPRIALVYDACLVPSVPAAPHDVPMTTIVTQSRTLDDFSQ